MGRRQNSEEVSPAPGLVEGSLKAIRLILQGHCTQVQTETTDLQAASFETATFGSLVTTTQDHPQHLCSSKGTTPRNRKHEKGITESRAWAGLSSGWLMKREEGDSLCPLRACAFLSLCSTAVPVGLPLFLLPPLNTPCPGTPILVLQGGVLSD